MSGAVMVIHRRSRRHLSSARQPEQVSPALRWASAVAWAVLEELWTSRCYRLQISQPKGKVPENLVALWLPKGEEPKYKHLLFPWG